MVFGNPTFNCLALSVIALWESVGVRPKQSAKAICPVLDLTWPIVGQKQQTQIAIIVNLMLMLVIQIAPWLSKEQLLWWAKNDVKKTFTSWGTFMVRKCVNYVCVNLLYIVDYITQMLCLKEARGWYFLLLSLDYCT